MVEVKWGNKTLTLERGLHKMFVRNSMRKSGQTYKEVMDSIFEID